MPVENGRIISGADVKALLGETTKDNDLIITLSIRRAEGAIRRYIGYDPSFAARTEFYPQSTSRGGGGGTVLDANDTHALFSSIGGNGSELQLKHLPIRSNPAIAIYVDSGAKAGTTVGSFAVATLRVEGADYWANYDGQDSSSYKICRDGILRSYGSWPSEPGGIKVIYSAGYTASEFKGQDASVDGSPIWDACLTEAVQRAKYALVHKRSATLGHLAGPLTHERLGDYDYNISSELAVKLFGVKQYDLMPESVDRLSEFINLGYSLLS